MEACPQQEWFGVGTAPVPCGGSSLGKCGLSGHQGGCREAVLGAVSLRMRISAGKTEQRVQVTHKVIYDVRVT